MARRDDGRTAINLRAPKEIVRRIKQAALDRDEKIQDIVLAALTAWLNANNK